MITYDKSFWGFALLTRLYGSALPRVVPVAIFTALFTLIIGSSSHSAVKSWWIHPFPYQAFSVVVGFILVFRTQYGYQRYWEACSQFHQMTSKLLDATTLIMTFDNDAVQFPRDAPAQHRADKFRAILMHLVSLIHATASQALRRDPNLSNLTRHSSKDPSPPGDPININRDSFKERTKVDLDAEIGQWNSWRDLFMLRASPRHLAKYNSAFPLPVIGHLSLQEAHALACEVEVGPNHPPHLAEESCCSAHVQYMQRPLLVAAWLHQLLVQRQMEGGMGMPAPIVSRAYHVLSEAMTAYDHCRKVASTPFPFPWSQFILVLLICFTLTCPVLIVAYVRPVWMSILLSTVSVATYWAINEVARDIEDPFIYEPNEIPLAKAQYDLNDALIAISRSRRPLSHLDVTGITESMSSCSDFSALLAAHGGGHVLRRTDSPRTRSPVFGSGLRRNVSWERFVPATPQGEHAGGELQPAGGQSRVGVLDVPLEEVGSAVRRGAENV